MRKKRNLLVNPEQIKVIIDLFERTDVKEVELFNGKNGIKITRGDYRKIIQEEGWYNKWWGKIIIGVIIAVIGKVVLELIF
ncbi:MAG: hypothetical protein IB617_02970 [Candidatus Nealsonbacteria bacterium]|nr:MAG: hypothetical protein IB617_02970 [Candidatus Nealsonbacteria bacterium]